MTTLSMSAALQFFITYRRARPMKSLPILVLASTVTLTACGRLDSKTAADLITASPDYQRTYIERTIVWTGRVPAEKLDGPLGEKVRQIGLINCVAGDPGYYTCSFPPRLAERAKQWEPEERGGYTDYRVPLYDQKLESVEMTERSSKNAEAIYTFHREPNEWGKKFGRSARGPTFRFKAFFRKYEDGWQVDRLKEES